MDTQWKFAIIETIKKLGGSNISLNKIYQLMAINPLVTEYHLEPWKLGGQPRYQCWIREYLSKLVDEGKVKRVSRGKYSLNIK